MNGPRRGGPARAAELRAGDLLVLLPLVAAMLVIALWPKGVTDATTRSLELNLAPAQIAADRPSDEIRARVIPNPPPEAIPLPGDEPTAEATP